MIANAARAMEISSLPARADRRLESTDMRFRTGRFLTTVTALAGLALAAPAHAQGAADFYRGKTINLVAGFNPGGGADTYARIIARHIGRHIPGNPTVIVRNMQGAGSVVAANHIFNVSPRDGTELGLFAGNITIDPLMGGTQHKYDARKFNWIGAPSSDSNVCLSSPKTPFKTIGDVLAREMITGTSGTSTYDFPVVMNNVVGAKFKLVKGYAGSAALRLAMERGEIEGFCGVGYHSMRTAGLTDGRANILVQVGLAKNPHMPNVPFIMDYAKSEQDRQIFRLVFGWLDLERPIGAPPGTPGDRIAALREGFERAMKDPALLADAEKAQVGIEPMTGAAIAGFVEEAYRTPAEVAAKAAQMLGRTP
jgi:tripartite-type tricarboxylate transporter receptor subunit TctC